MAKKAKRRALAPSPSLPSERSQSLLDVVDNLIDKGVAVDGEVVLGLADIDLVYVRLGALIAAADRVFEPHSGPPSRRRRASHAWLSAPRRAASVTTAAAPASPVPAQPSHRPATRAAGTPAPPADETSRSVMKLVLTVVEFVRQLLERQAVRRVNERSLTPDEIERLGAALMRLESTVHDLADRHGLDPAELNLDLGPVGKLL